MLSKTLLSSIHLSPAFFLLPSRYLDTHLTSKQGQASPMYTSRSLSIMYFSSGSHFECKAAHRVKISLWSWSTLPMRQKYCWRWSFFLWMLGRGLFFCDRESFHCLRVSLGFDMQELLKRVAVGNHGGHHDQLHFLSSLNQKRILQLWIVKAIRSVRLQSFHIHSVSPHSCPVWSVNIHESWKEGGLHGKHEAEVWGSQKRRTLWFVRATLCRLGRLRP